MVEREIPGTPHPVGNNSGTYVPPAHQFDAPETVQPLAYTIDGRSFAEVFSPFATVASDTSGFAFDPDHLNAMAKEWDKLGDAYSDKQRYAQRLMEIQGPGDEYASKIHAEAVRNTGRAMSAAFQDRQQYCRDQAQKFRSAAGHYAKVDNDNRDVVGHVDTSSPRSPF
ncbi:MAG TPA: PE domain-containing protein [Amycolatopsis sp.]|uniref:PE domain-containing protein n=1 Tax=Amycolatopsis sp. TaxID=37632 RepID=UPI002B48ECAF|nr:PE domain-containing protein [Amycolatopsis sp.]HKS44084.1 PE domain-containing protein [Amycolatopsis sp.]